MAPFVGSFGDRSSQLAVHLKALVPFGSAEDWESFEAGSLLLRYPTTTASKIAIEPLRGNSGYAVLSGYLASTYSNPNEFIGTSPLQAMAERLLGNSNPVLPPDTSGVYTLIVIDLQQNRILVASDTTSCSPFYYAVVGTCFLFSTLFRPLATLARREFDPLGIAEYLSLGWTVGRRTLFYGVNRLLPDERLTFCMDDATLSHSFEPPPRAVALSGSELEEQVWETWLIAVRRVSQLSQSPGLMLSGGIDSRFLGGAFVKAGRHPFALTHGTDRGREMNYARKTAVALGLEHREVFLNSGLLPTRDRVIDVFDSVEDLELCWWIHAAECFAQNDVDSACSGFLLDAMLGGDFLSAPKRPVQLLVHRLKQSVGITRAADRVITQVECAEFVRSQADLAVRSLRSPARLLDPDVREMVMTASKDIATDVDGEVRRLSNLTGPCFESLRERFFVEQRSRKFVFSQDRVLLTKCKLYVPAADADFVALCRAIPPSTKAGHRLYYSVVRRFLHSLAEIPTSTTVVPLTWPVAALELIRAGRKYNDLRRVSKYLQSGGMDIRGSLSGAIDFERVCRTSGDLETIESLLIENATIIHRQAVETELLAIREFRKRLYVMAPFLRLLNLQLSVR